MLGAVFLNADMSHYVITIFSKIHDIVHHNVYVHICWHMHVGLFLSITSIHSYVSLLVESLFFIFCFVNQAIINRNITPSSTPTIITLNMIHTTMIFPLQQCILVCFTSLGGSGDIDDLGSLTGSGSGGAGLSAGSTRGLGLNMGGRSIGRGGGGGGGGGGIANIEYCGGDGEGIRTGMGMAMWCTGHGSPSHVERVDCTERDVPSAG